MQGLCQWCPLLTFDSQSPLQLSVARIWWSSLPDNSLTPVPCFGFWPGSGWHSTYYHVSVLKKEGDWDRQRNTESTLPSWLQPWEFQEVVRMAMAVSSPLICGLSKNLEKSTSIFILTSVHIEWLNSIFQRWLVSEAPFGISKVSWDCFPNNSGSIKLPSVLCLLIFFQIWVI